MQAHKSILILILLIAVLCSFLLVPSKKEQALMFLNDRQLDRAEKIYASLQSESNVDRNILTPLSHIYLERGDVVSATQLFEQYLTKNEDDMEVRENLFQLYRDGLKPYELVETLERIVERNPSVEYYEQLLSLYKDLGVGGERLSTALEKIIAFDASREKEQKELILLLASHGKSMDASNQLDQYLLRYPEKVDQNIAELRLKLLLSSDRKQDAYAWAKKWLSKHSSLSIRYMALLYSNGKMNDLDVALTQSDVVAVSDMPAWLIDMFMSQDWAEKKQEVLEKFVDHLDDKKRHRYPIVMLDLAIKNKDEIGISKWLTLAENKTDLTQNQRVSLMLSYFKLGKASEGMKLLSGLTDSAALSTRQIAQTVKFIISAKLTIEGEVAFQALRVRRAEQNMEADSALDGAWLLLASASGETQKVSQWLDGQSDGKISVELLTNTYYAAEDRKQFSLASIIARKLYAKAPNKEVTRMLSDALLGLKKRTPEEHAELVSLLIIQAKEFHPSRKQRRDIAFKLLSVGEKKAAELQFMLLARRQGPHSEDMAQLLFLWGATPESAVLEWLRRRARTAPDEDLARWWQYLIQMGGAEIVVEMSEDKVRKSVNRRLPVEADNELVNALIAIKDFSGLDKKLNELADSSKNKKRLEALASHANSAKLLKTEKKIWKKLSEVQPKHGKALRELGVAAFDRGDLSKAEDYLAQYMKVTKGDWEAALYLGDIYQAYDKHQQAQSSYKKSLNLLGNKLAANKTKTSAQAYLLSQLGKTKQAMSVYDKLIQRYPEDIDLRVRYSDLLIDVGRIEQARQLLGARQ